MDTDINSTNTSQPLPPTNQIPNQPIVEPKDNKLVKVLLFVVGAIVFMVIGAFGFFFFQNKTLQNQPNQTLNNQNPTNITTPSKTPEITTDLTNYSTVTKANQQDKSKTDIYIKNIKTGEETFLITLSDVYAEHFHNSEYHNGNLYVIRRTGNSTYPSEAWMDELWKYDSSKNGQKLFSLKGLNFLVPSNESLIGITDGATKLVFIDRSGKTIQEFTLSQISSLQAEPIIGLNSWTSDGSILWGDLSLGPVSAAFFKVNTKNWSVTKYDVSTLSFGTETALNADMAKIAYSDYPALFDVDGANAFKASKKKVTLYIYDLNTKSNIVVNTSIVKQFSPKWIDTKTLEYNNPNSDSRLTYPIQ